MRFLFAYVAICVLAGCSQYSADLSFARAPGLGYRNAGLFPPGRLYLFDSTTATLTKLADDIPLRQIPIADPPTTLTSTNIRGIALNGTFGSPQAKLGVAAEIGSKVAFVAERAQREKYSSVYTALTEAYKGGLAAGEDMKSRWYVDDVTRRNSGLYYVVINEIVRTDRTSLSTGGPSGSQIASISVTPPGMPPISVSVTDSKLVECSGSASPCFFDATVISPYKNEQGNLDFKVARNVNVDLLSEAFRKL